MNSIVSKSQEIMFPLYSALDRNCPVKMGRNTGSGSRKGNQDDQKTKNQERLKKVDVFRLEKSERRGKYNRSFHVSERLSYKRGPRIALYQRRANLVSVFKKEKQNHCSPISLMLRQNSNRLLSSQFVFREKCFVLTGVNIGLARISHAKIT